MESMSRPCNTKEERLVTREDLEDLIKEVKGLDDLHREYLKRRWVGMVMWWHTRSVKARWKYFSLRAVVVAGGVLIPVLTTLSMRTGWQDSATIAIAVVGAIVAGCAAWEGVANYGEIWREKRRSAELLKVEGWQYLELCGKYEVGKEFRQPSGEYELSKGYTFAFPRFVSEVESMIAREVGEYLGVFDPSLGQAKKAAETLISAIAEEATRRIRVPSGSQDRMGGA
jgi:hypothetical protein